MSNARERIEKVISENPVVLFMKGTPEFPQCGFSGQVIQILDYLGAPVVGVNVLEDADIRQEIKEYANWPTIPQLYIKGEFVGGCDITREMFQSGELRERCWVAESSGRTPGERRRSRRPDITTLSVDAIVNAVARRPAAGGSLPRAACRAVADAGLVGRVTCHARRRAGLARDDSRRGGLACILLSAHAERPTRFRRFTGFRRSSGGSGSAKARRASLRRSTFWSRRFCGTFEVACFTDLRN